MALFDPIRVAAAANDDGEFRLMARFWDGDVRFGVGDDAYHLEVRDGRVTRFAPLDAALAPSTWTLSVTAPRETWEQMLVPAPKPFFHDLNAAAAREGVTLEGALLEYAPYYRSIARLIEIMRTPREG